MKSIMINEDASNIVDLRYEVEADFLHALGQGDKQKVIELLNSDDLLFSFSERFPNQPLRRVKNLVIVINTLFRTVARRKMSPYFNTPNIGKVCRANRN